jgi:SAM-dependent methyltransferase
MTAMGGRLLRSAAEVAYRLGLGPMPSETPDARLIELVEGSSHPTPGRALDLGCGTGRNLLYLAAQGWDATGVEMVARAVAVTRGAAAARGLPTRVLHGDVTRPEELAAGDGYTLLMDGGCYHMVPAHRRDAYAESVTRVAAPGATLLVVGFAHGRFAGAGVTEEELRGRLPAWEMVDAAPVPGAEMQGYVRGPAVVRTALARGWLRAWRYQLRRRGATSG